MNNRRKIQISEKITSPLLTLSLANACQLLLMTLIFFIEKKDGNSELTIQKRL